MDKKLHELKYNYKQKYDKHFTSQDRNAIYHKISNKHNSTHKNLHSSFRVGLTFVAIIMIGFLVMMNVFDSREPASDPEIETKPENEMKPNPLQDETTFEGYVVHVQGSQATVTNIDTRESMIFRNIIPGNVMLGDQVKGWLEYTLSSEPPTASIEKLEIINDKSQNGSNFNENFAVRTALKETILKSYGTSNYDDLYVSNIDYSQDRHRWYVELYNSNMDKRERVEVSDNTGYIAKPHKPEESFQSEYTFNYEAYGQQFKELEQMIIWNLNSKWTELHHLSRQDYENRFGVIENIDYSYILNGAAIDENGTVTIDFRELKASSTSNETRKFINEIKRLVFQFDEAKEVYIQFNGSLKDTPFEISLNTSIKRNENEEPFDLHEDMLRTNKGYIGTFKYLLQYNDDGKLEFESQKDLESFFTRYMSEELAQEHIDTYIHEDQGNFYVNFSYEQLPTAIDRELFDAIKINDQTFEVQSDVQTEHGFKSLKYIIKYNNYKWYVDSVEVSPM
ncbi:hypothetical protein E3U55_07945 [Filobacillus milosensis]|uniref:Uncharacterized protein n=1 Tax=Filobacillus milosensis TaxID=94137 RepID=A0A4Y8IMY8_9BACI|nr:GerMN domain-containing protein [Filobacillus milosensis]TFB21752.1 hypothetical protein E3U55_07945 [Filobacillus milosensis]